MPLLASHAVTSLATTGRIGCLVPLVMIERYACPSNSGVCRFAAACIVNVCLRPRRPLPGFLPILDEAGRRHRRAIIPARAQVEMAARPGNAVGSSCVA